MSEEDFLALRAKFPDATLEYTEDGTLIILPPTDPENSERVTGVEAQLHNRAREKADGHVIGPDGGFRFPGGSRRSPDAAWFADDRWKEAGHGFPPSLPSLS